MRLRNLITLTILLTLVSSCSVFGTHKTSQAKPEPSYTPLSEKRMNCIDKLIKLDVKPLQAGEICGNVYNQR